MTKLYPMLTERRLVEPIWGGAYLAEWLNLPEPRPTRLGEAWQVYDDNLIKNGSLAGRHLAEVSRTYGTRLVGTRSFARYGADFPLLAKFIHASDRLSIQVHPDDVYAHSHEAGTGFHGKTEAWYILAAEPGANITYGLSQPSNREAFAAAVQAGTVDTLLQHLPVQAGDTIFVPAGMLHAINAGILLFEIQQKSDLTYRVYDYNRLDAKTGRPRTLHLEKALDVSNFGAAPYGKITPLSIGPGRDLLIACPYFALERWSQQNSSDETTNHGSFEILTVIDGEASMSWTHGNLAITRGDSLLLPADLGWWGLAPMNGKVTLLRSYVPDLEGLTDQLRKQGHWSNRIAEVARSR